MFKIKQYLPVFFFVLSLSFPLHIFNLIKTYGVDVLNVDDWPHAALVYASVNNQTTLSDWFSSINGHLPLVIRSFFYIQFKFNLWNMVISLYIGEVLMIVSWLLITLISFKTLGREKRIKISIGSLLTSIILFSPAASEHWMLPVLAGLSIFTVLFSGAVTLLTYYPGTKSVVISSFLCFLTTFCYGAGIMSYVALFPLILKISSRNNEEKTNVLKLLISKQVLFWIISFIGTALIYSFNFFSNINDYDGNINEINERRMSQSFAFLMQITGAPLGLGVPNFYTPSLIWGILILVTFFYLMLKLLVRTLNDPQQTNFLPWLSIGWLGFLTNLLTTYFRAPMVPNQSLNPRYIIPSSLILVSIVYFVLQLDFTKVNFLKKKAFLKLSSSALVLGFCVYSYILTWQSGLSMSEHISTSRLQSQACFAFVQDCPNRFAERAIDIIYLKRDYEKLASLGMVRSGQKTDTSSSSEPVYGQFDNLMIAPEYDNKAIGVWGWAISPDDVWAATVVITKDNDPTFLGLTSANRPSPDLAKQFPGQRYSQAHWSTIIPLDEIGSGTHTFQAFVYSHKLGRLIPLAKTHTLTIP